MSMIKVAVGVIINNKNQVLIAKRASHQHQGDKWEFPGGKVENDEAPQEALKRELQEELGIEIQSAHHLIEITHKYRGDNVEKENEKSVCLKVYTVKKWLGEAVGREGQPLRWVDKTELHQYEFPAANAEILSILGVL